MTRPTIHISFLAFVLLAASLLPAPNDARAQAGQGIAALVNDEPISDYDVRQRMRLISVSTRQSPSEKLRKSVIEQLINERLMLQEAKRLEVSVSKEDIRGALGRMASRNNMSADQFSQALAQIGVDVRTLTDKIEAELSWRESIQRRFGRTIRIQDADIDRELDKSNPLGGEKVYEVELQQIVLLITGQGSEASTRARIRDASYVRSNFQSCDTTRTRMAGIKDVVINKIPPRSTASIAEASVKEAVVKGDVGTVTEPRATPQGIEIYALCAKREISGDDAARAGARASILNQQFSELAQRHLRDLRQDAVIDIR